LVQLPTFFSGPEWWMDKVAQAEVKICERTAELYPKNYYAWTHRQWLVEHITRLPHLVTELGAVTKWTDTHVSDHCGYHHRQVILKALLRLTPRHYSLGAAAMDHRYTPPLPCAANWSTTAGPSLWGSVSIPSVAVDTITSTALLSSSASPLTGPLAPTAPCLGCAIWNEEFNYISMQMDRYPGHETLWSHRRFVYSAWLRMVAQHHMEFAPVCHRFTSHEISM
jgi:protein prenyltransferase alpha subunit repeat containing protein 1